jgi:hypothetical protein
MVVTGNKLAQGCKASVPRIPVLLVCDGFDGRAPDDTGRRKVWLAEAEIDAVWSRAVEELADGALFNTTQPRRRMKLAQRR